MNIQNLQSPPDDRYNDFLLSSKGDNLQGSNMGKSNLFQNLEQLELTNSEDLNNKKKAPINYDNNINNLINPPKNQNKIYQISPNTYNNNNNNNEVLDSSPISIAKLIQEKESLSHALKREIIKNEEQRNYIQVLKETIESNLYRSGFAEILAASKEYQQFQEYNEGQGKTMADFVVDFIKFKEETNKMKKDLMMSNNIISDSKNEINTLNKKVNDMHKKNLELKNNISKEQNEKEYMMLKDSENNNLINKLNNNIRLLEEENANLKAQILEYQDINLKNDNKMRTNYNQMEIMSNNLNRYKDYEQKYKDLLIDFERIKIQNDENEKQKQKLEKLYQTLKDENSILNNKFKNLEKNFSSLGKTMEEVNDKYNNFNSNQDEIEKLKSIINEKEKENRELYDKLNILSSEGDMVNIENRNNIQRIKDCMTSIDRLKYEKNVVGDEFANLHKKYENLLIEFNQSQKQNDLLSTNFDRLKNEYNILLEEKNKQEVELEDNMNKKYIKEKEMNDLENKYNDDIIKLQKENNELNSNLQNALENLNNLKEDNYKLKEMNEATNQKLREKIENEQILLKENMNYKSCIDDLNLQHRENVKEFNNKMDNFNELNKNYNTIKSEYSDLQKLLKNASEEKSILIDKNRRLVEENKDIDEHYRISLNKLLKINKINIGKNSVNEYLKQSADEIVRLQTENNKLNENIKILNMKCFDTAQENQINKQENNKLKTIINNLSTNYKNDLNEKENLLKEIDNYKLMNYQLQKTIDDYGNELNSKIADLNNISYNKSEVENANIKLNNDKEFLLTILLRLTKLFSHSNIYDLVNDVFNNSKFNDKDSKYQSDMNQKLMQELQRCEDYVNMLKENDLQANYLNLKLNQEIQDLNLEKLRNETKMQTYNTDINNYESNENRSKNNSYRTLNTVNNNGFWTEYSNKSLNNKIFDNYSL